MQPTVLQILPELDVGGVERGTLEIAAELVRRKHRSIVVSGPGRLVSQLIAEGSEHINLAVGKKSLLSARFIPQLRNIFHEQKIDIIHARSRFPAWLAYLAWKQLDPKTRPAFMTTVHGPYSVNRYSKIMTQGQKIIAISEYIKNYILDNYPNVDEEKIELIHRGINKEKYPYGYKPSAEWLSAWQNQHPNLKGKFLVTLPARVTRWKGHNDFIEIIAKAIKNNLNIHGLIAGGADIKKQGFIKELETQINDKKMGDHFTFLGHRDDMKEIMSISNIVLSLAKTPEAFGRTALEALSLGVPVIAYDHGGAAEVLAKIFPEGKATPLNIDHVVSLIMRFYQAVPIVPDENHFTLEIMLNKTLSIYSSFR